MTSTPNYLLQAAITGQLTQQLPTDNDARDLPQKIRADKPLPPTAVDDIPDKRPIEFLLEHGVNGAENKICDFDRRINNAEHFLHGAADGIFICEGINEMLSKHIDCRRAQPCGHKLRTCVHRKKWYDKYIMREIYETDLTDERWEVIEPLFVNNNSAACGTKSSNTS